MNRIYRLCWNRNLKACVVASELATNRGGADGGVGRRSAGPASLKLGVLALALGMCGLASAGTLPTGGQVVGGAGQISQSGDVTTIRQQSQVLSLNWQGFDIGARQTVNFLQPGAGSIAVNRVLGNTASEIYGHLNANGQVWLINPNGVLFGQGAQVNAGGILASTLDLDAGTLGTGSVRFAGDGRGSVVNQGSLTAAPGGYVALLGNTVSNQGTIRAQLGTVALAGGTAMTLTFAGSRLMHVVVDAGTVRSLVENRQLVVADGGQVLMTAGARASLIDSAVNNTGIVQARTVAEHDGVITLLSGMGAGTTHVAGTLDASAPDGGKGGFVETSGANVKVADAASVTTAAAAGKAGTWLIDPTDFTIAASGGDITGSTLATNLGTGNVSFTNANGAAGTAGNVNVNDAVAWSANTTLTLTASHDVAINAGGSIANSGASGKTVLNAGRAFVNNAGAGALGGHWAIYSANAATMGGLTPGFIQYNAPQGTAAATGATGNGLFYDAAAAIAIGGFNGVPTKGYDGTTNLLVSNLIYTLGGGGAGDVLDAITGGYSQSDVGSSLTVKAPTAGSAYRIQSGGIPVFGYTVSGAGSASVSNGSITQAALGISIVGPTVANPGAYSLSKVYDGTNSITLNAANYQITGVAAGESITVNQPSQVGYGTLSGGSITAVADVNTVGGTILAGGGGPQPIAAIFINTNFKAGAGTKLGNYNLNGLTATGTGAITQAPVYLGGVSAQNRTYDTTNVAPLDKSNASIFGIVNNDAVTLDAGAGAGSFADANAGNGKAVTLTGFTLAGADPVKVADYNLIIPANLTANIARAPLSVYGVAVTDKVYDGSTATTAGELDLSGVNFTGTKGSDSLTLDQSGALGHFSQADVGSELDVTVGGFQIRNADNSVNNNYSIGSVQGGTSASPVDLIANITPRPLVISFSGSADKIYDGTSYATLHTADFSIANVVAGESVAVHQAPASYSGASVPNVGSDTVTAHVQASDLDFTSGAKVGNYTFNTTVSGAGNILPAPLSIVIDGNPTKPYDGTSTATLTAGNFKIYGVIPGEGVSVTGPFTANYYNGAPGTPESNAGGWGVEATLSAGNYTFTASGVNPSGSLSNYTLPNPVLGFGTINPAPISGQVTASLIDAGVHHLTKVYDGNTAITLDPSNIVFSGFAAGDSASVNGSLTGVFDTKDVGKQPLSAVIDKANVTVTCAGGGQGCLGNYTYDGTAVSSTHSLNDASWSITARGTGEIFAKDLFITLTGVTKTYDGNTTVLPLDTTNFHVYGYVNNDVSGVADSGWVTGEGAAITPTASFTYGSPNVSRDGGGVVQSDIRVQGSLTPHNYTPTGATLLSNYNLVYTIDQNVGEITPAPLFVSGVRVRDKIYDGGAGALVSIRNGQLAGLADVDRNAAAITLNVGKGTVSTADGIAGSATATLTPNSDGTFTPTGSPTSGTFASVNAGSNQAVSTIFTLGGSSAANYTLVAPSLTASIARRPLTVTGITANAKTYDGGTAATFTYTAPIFNAESGTGTAVTGLLTSDAGNVTMDQAASTGTFATPNANADPAGMLLNSDGGEIAVSASLVLGGSAAANYALSQPGGLSANILQKQITLTLAGPVEKYYDGTSSVTIPKGNDQSAGDPSTGYHTLGWIAGEGATITQTHSAHYASPDASVDGSFNPIGGGDGRIDVTANLVSSDWQPAAGTSLVNYALPTTVTAHVGAILALPLDLTATRVYDATTNIYASLSGNVTNDDNANVFGTLTGVNGDSFTVTGTGTASSKNVGTYTNGAGFGLGSLALVSVSGNPSNYTLIGGVDSYTITRAPLNITGGTVNAKVYDGTTAATVAGATLTAGNTKGDVLGTDTVTLVTDGSGDVAGTFNNKNAGTGKPVTINASAVTGADAGNYEIVQPPGLAGTITGRPVTLSGSREYDATTTVTGSSGAITWAAPGAETGNADSGVVAGDTVKVNGGVGSVTSANVGTYHTDGSGDGTFDAGTLTLDNANYVISATGNQFAITPHVITLSGTRVYDGTTDAAATLFAGTSCGALCVTLTGVGAETLDLSGTGTLSSADVAGPVGAPTQVAFDSGVGSPFGFGLTGNAGGAQASNYALKGGVTITPYVLSFSGTRVYDGTKAVRAADLKDATAGSGTTGTATFSGLGTDRFTVGGAGVLSSANAGSYGGGAASGVGGTPANAAQIGVAGLSLTAVSGKASNYTLVGGTDSYVITKAPVTLTGIRQYDAGTTAAGGSVIANTSSACAVGSTCWVVNGVVAADRSQLAVTGSTGTGAIPSADVGSYGNGGAGGTFASTGLALGGSAAINYAWTPSATDQFIVKPKVLDLSGTRVYDGGTTIDASLFGASGLLTGVAGETVQLTGSGVLSSKNVNGGTPYTGTGIAGATSGQGFNLGTLALAAGGTGKASNYTLVGGSDALTLTPLAITVAATAADKSYDGTTTATVTGLSSGGVLGGDTVTFANTAANFDDKNAAAGKTVTVTGISAGGADGGNYAVNTTATTTAAVTPKVLDLSGTRAYDATTDADAKAFGNKDNTINGVTVGGVTEVLSLTGTGTSGKADAGTYTRNPGSVTAPVAGSMDFGLGSLALGDNAGALAGNYTLVGGNDRFVITPAGIALSVTIAGARPYDGTTTALDTDFGSAGVITTSLGETLDLSGQGTLTGKNVGTYQTSDGTLALGSLALNDGTGAGAGKASNYALTSGTFSVTKRVLGLSGTRAYDGTTDAGHADLTLGNLVTGETLGITGAGVLSSKNVNGGTPYTGTGVAGAVGGQGFNLGTLGLVDGVGLAGNYTLAGGADSFVLTPLAITVAATAADKPYDGTTTATVTGLTSGGVIGGDAVTFANTGANFADQNAGVGKTVTVAGITASGADAGNYSVGPTTTTTATITPKVLDLIGTRVYDTTKDAAAGDLRLGGLVGGETLALSGLGQVVSKNVGSYTGGDFTLGTLALANGTGLAGNYTLTGGVDTLTITPAPLTVGGLTAASKTYDGTTAATVTGGTLSGVLGGDTVTLSVGGSGTFATPNAGTGIAVSVDAGIGGADAGNYTLSSSIGAVADIYRKVLDLTGTRVYDGSTAADAGYLVLSGLVGGQTLVLSGSAQVGDKNVDQDKPFTSLGSLTLGDGGNGGLAGNYTLVGGTDLLSITPRTITVVATGTDKVYDGTTPDDVTLAGNGLIPGDAIDLGYGAAHFDDPAVGNDKRVTVTGVTIGGSDAGNYVLADSTVYTNANITGGGTQPPHPGLGGAVDSGILASLYGAFDPTELATPYGLAPQVTVGPYAGNKKRLHEPVERNASRSDFVSGLALKVIDGGVRVPTGARP